ncbi:SRPBCC family protein [Mangrovicella endophytica]|uniref:SRPBCC family protein n=1 Tax=Mangrovicella endophytica TaxID=2066697 RepID=UPI000C9DE897|nr:SRPBCC domain-containing protein [Mangrovicella endophytica]
MTPIATAADTNDIVLDEIVPHPPAVVWRALTTGDLIARWLMPPTGFAPVEGCRFTFRTNPAGAWDGTIRCEVLEVVENQRFAFSWKGGDAGNIGYGSRLDTVVTWTLTPSEAGTHLRLVHSGFALPDNEVALKNMGEGWRRVVPRLKSVADEEPS